MWVLLIWRLSGNRVAGILQKSIGGPSISYLRSCSIVPPIIPSPGKPTIDQVEANVMALLKNVLKVMHDHIRGKVFAYRCNV